MNVLNQFITRFLGRRIKIDGSEVRIGKSTLESLIRIHGYLYLKASLSIGSDWTAGLTYDLRSLSAVIECIKEDLKEVENGPHKEDWRPENAE